MGIHKNEMLGLRPSIEISETDKQKGSLSIRKDGDLRMRSAPWTPLLSQLERLCKITPALLGVRLTCFSQNQIILHWTKKDGTLWIESIRARSGTPFEKFQQIFRELDNLAVEVRAQILKTVAINPRLFKILEGNGWREDEFDEETATENLRTFIKPIDSK